MVNYKNIIVQATDQNAYRIRGNVLWFIPFILFFSIVIYILGLSVYSNWFYLSIILLTVCLNIKFQGYRILMRPYVLICLYYFVFCLFQGLLSGVKLRVALQDMYGILYFFTSYSIVLSDRFSDRCIQAPVSYSCGSIQIYRSSLFPPSRMQELQHTVPKPE